jgi:cardiolipin synthase A/B
MRRFPVILIFLFFTLLIGGCISTSVDTETAISSQNITGVMGDRDTYTPSDHTLLVEPEDGKREILSMIAGAHDNLTLTIYELTDPEIIAALDAAHGRGVSVRILYNKNSFVSMKKKNPNDDTVANLARAGVAVKPASSVFMVTHQKTLTADESRSCVMTFNLEPGYFNTTRDFGIVTTNRSEVREISRVFDADWNYQNITPTFSSLVWSPVNSRIKILGVINHAKRALDVYNEEITDKQCIKALAEAAKRGIIVRVIAADQENNGKNNNAAAITNLNSNGAQAKTITSRYIHAKMILADYGTPDQIAYIGSENFGSVSLDKNRELGILIVEPAILERVESVFSKDWLEPAMPEP